MKKSAFWVVAVLILLIAVWLLLRNRTPGVTVDTTGGSDTTSQEGWKQFSDNQLAFEYPAALGTDYIFTVDWPPQVQVSTSTFACLTAGSPTASGGQTQYRKVGDHNYCVTEEVGAAAGSTYSQYAYAFERDLQTVIMTFSLRRPECSNYPETEAATCESEQKAFQLDPLVDKMANTLEFLK